MALFEKKKISVKCENCLIKKRSKVINKVDDVLLTKKGNGDILFILEMPEYDKVLYKFKKFLESNLINSYQIISGIQCQTDKFEIPTPMYKSYRNCNCLKKDYDCKVIVTVGRSIPAVTHSDDLVSWRDFAEFNFNQTYFITPFDWNKKLRVYPIPSLIDWIHEKDNFEKFFTLFQISQIKKYLKNYEEVVVEKYELIEEVEDVNKFLEDHIDEKVIAWDLETKHLNHFAKDFFIICMTVSFDGKKGYYLPFEKINKRLLSNFLKGKENILANGKFDIKALYLERIKNIEMSEDVVLLHHCLNTQRINNGIKSLAWLIGLGGYDQELDKYKDETKIKTYDQIPKKLLSKYAIIDSILTYRLYEYGLKLSEIQPDVYNCYKKYIIPSFPAFLEMEVSGIQVDKNYISEKDKELKNTCIQIEKEVQKELNETFDLASNQQLAKILEKNKWRCFGRSDKQFYINENNEKCFYYNVGVEQLEQWKSEGYTLAEKILKYRSVSKLRDAFLGSVKKEESFFIKSQKEEKEKGLIKYIQDDGLIHPTFNTGRTNSGRDSANYPNSQQFPVHGEEGKLFKPSIACPDDCYIVEADYSGFQLRIAAIYSNDETMIKIFKTHGDMHSVTAQEIFHKDILLEDFLKIKNKDPYYTSRYKAKNQINFPLIFSDNPYVIYGAIKKEWTEKEINDYIQNNKLNLIETKDGYFDYVLTVCIDLHKKFFNKYAKLRPWIESQYKFGMQNGYTDSWFKGRRHLPELKYIGKDIDKKKLSNLKNISTNSDVQNFEAMMMKKSLRKIYDNLNKHNMKTKFMNTIHDSVAFYSPKNEIKDLYHILKENMEDHTTWKIPITIDVSIGKIWKKGKEIENENNLQDFII